MAEAVGDTGYAEFVTKWPFTYYLKRVRQIDFVGFSDVLDVGCGNGQWMLALAAYNQHVFGVDPNAKRVATANSLFEKLWVKNACAHEGDALQLKFPDERFDAVFCYGVFMFLDRQAALNEFHRVLRPGGKLYICTNARGWWLKLAISNVLTNWALSRTAWAAFRFGRARGMPNSTDLSDMNILSDRQWTNIQAAAEGSLLLAETSEAIEPVYASKYMNFDNVIEFVATKRSVDASIINGLNLSAALIDSKADIAINAVNYSYEARLEKYPSADQPCDLVNATNIFAVEYAVALANSTSRVDVLKHLFHKITTGIKGEKEKLIACIIFSQKVFYHHFGLQPMIQTNRILLDPVASFLFEACRCGNSARFLIDLLLINGYQARLLGGGCHTSAEVNVNGRWVLADSSLFPPGVVPQNVDGSLISLAEVSHNPYILDQWPSYINYNSNHINLFALRHPRTAAAIETWLKFPIPPSVAFFGQDFCPNQPGMVRRWEKNGNATAWEGDPDFGWNDLAELNGIQGLGIPTCQRPAQVRSLKRINNVLFWPPSETAGNIDVEYKLFIGIKNRGWSYSSIPVGFSFELDAPTHRTSQTQLKLDDRFATVPLYITILANDKAFPNAFVLPSVEFVV
jgi:SAM-dependent methyltransferase